MSTDTNTKTDTKIVIHKKKPSDKLLKLINEAVDTGVKLKSQFDEIWEQGAKEGFSKQEIGEIVRPIARAKGLDKDQVYYLTHKPDLQNKAKQQYELKKIDLDRKPEPISRNNSEFMPSPKVEADFENWKLEDLQNWDKTDLIKLIQILHDKIPKHKPKVAFIKQRRKEVDATLE